MKVAVMGTGGVGGYFGALLARAGHDVTFIARGAHLEAIRRDGLKVESNLSGDFIARATATDQPSSVGPVDFVLFTPKMYHNAEAIPAIKPMVGENTLVLSLQNGVDNGDRLAEVVGKEHVLLGAVYVHSIIKEPGVIQEMGQFARVVFGEMEPGINQRCQKLLSELQAAGWPVELAENMPAVLWTKFVFVAAASTVCSATGSPGATYGELRMTPEARQVLREAMEEIAAVGRARGVNLPSDVVEQSLAVVDRVGVDSRSSMAMDFAAGRRGELEGLAGTVVRLGQEADVPTPVNLVLYALLKPQAQRAERVAAEATR